MMRLCLGHRYVVTFDASEPPGALLRGRGQTYPKWVAVDLEVPEDLDRPDAEALVKRALTRPVAARVAFDVKVEDEPVWMSAMTERSQALPSSFALSINASPSSLDRGAIDGAVHA